MIEEEMDKIIFNVNRSVAEMHIEIEIILLEKASMLEQSFQDKFAKLKASHDATEQRYIDALTSLGLEPEVNDEPTTKALSTEGVDTIDNLASFSTVKEDPGGVEDQDSEAVAGISVLTIFVACVAMFGIGTLSEKGREAYASRHKYLSL